MYSHRYIDSAEKRQQRMCPPGPYYKMSKNLLGCDIAIPRQQEYYVGGACEMIEYANAVVFDDFTQANNHCDAAKCGEGLE